MSGDLKRLLTFSQWPMPEGACSEKYNFIFRAAQSHWERSADCVEDEVICKSCGVTFRNWRKESPSAVHRTISPNCPSLNSPPSKCFSAWSTLRQNPFQKYLPDRVKKLLPKYLDIKQSDAAYRTPDYSAHHRQTQAAKNVRRVLFPGADDQHQQMEVEVTSISESMKSTDCQTEQTLPSVLDQTPVMHPFQPKYGGYSNLFASYRLKTFSLLHSDSANNRRKQQWAEEGFVYISEQCKVMCVYCGTVLPLNEQQMNPTKSLHIHCPFVIGIDVGNISHRQERAIMEKYYQQHIATAKLSRKSSFTIKYPHYEKEEDRIGTFKNWPKMCFRVFPANHMVSAGFFYSGCSDKVTCYSCGVELFDWNEAADIWQMHARVSPACLHVIDEKGQEFIAQAASAKLLVDVKYPKYSYSGLVSSSDGLVEEEPGCFNIDMTAVKAAQACRFPNKAILKAALKAADENHIVICKQQEVVLQKDSQLQQKDSQLQQNYNQLQQNYSLLQQKNIQLQQKDSQLQQKDSQLNQMYSELAESYQQIQSLMQQVQQMQTQGQQLQMQDQQIQCLMQQVQQLRADKVLKVHPTYDHSTDSTCSPRTESDDLQHPYACKICTSDKPRMFFLPCGHLFSCAMCTSRLPERRCPVCRQDIAEILPAFEA